MNTSRNHMGSLPSDEDKRAMLEKANVVWVDKNNLLWVIVDGSQICLGSAPEIVGSRPHVLDERNKT